MRKLIYLPIGNGVTLDVRNSQKPLVLRRLCRSYQENIFFEFYYISIPTDFEPQAQVYSSIKWNFNEWVLKSSLVFLIYLPTTSHKNVVSDPFAYNVCSLPIYILDTFQKANVWSSSSLSKNPFSL